LPGSSTASAADVTESLARTLSACASVVQRLSSQRAAYALLEPAYVSVQAAKSAPLAAMPSFGAPT
jgi:hypothetical protein